MPTKLFGPLVISFAALLISSSLWVMWNDGLKNRHEKLYASTNIPYEFDNKKLARDAVNLEKINSQTFKNIDNFNLLIIGDLHGRNLFNILHFKHINGNSNVDVMRKFHRMYKSMTSCTQERYFFADQFALLSWRT